MESKDLRKTIENTIQREKRLVLTLKDLGLIPTPNSPLDISYFKEVESLVGVPSQDVLKENGINPDLFVEDYVKMIYGEIDIQKTLEKWEETLQNIKIPYKRKSQSLREFINKEKTLYKSLKKLGVENSDKGLGFVVSSWDLATALFNKSSDDFYSDLLRVVEGEFPFERLKPYYLNKGK